MKEIYLKLQRFLESRWHMLAVFVAAVLTTVFSAEHYAIPVFVLWMVFVILVDENFTDILLPIVLLNAMALRTIGQSTYHEKHLWLAIPVVIGIILHFIIFPRKITLGKSFYPLCAITVALLLGGVGVISKEEYFNVSSLYYVIFLGIGMIAFYLWMRHGIRSTESYDIKERILEILYIVGIFCAFTILEKALRMYISYGELRSFAWCNDICEIMIFALPVPFFYVRRHFIHFFVPFLMYLATMPAKSMTAVVVGAALLVLGVIYTFVVYKEKRRHVLVTTAAIVLAGVIAVMKFDLIPYDSISSFVDQEENGRMWLFRRAWERFLEHPWLGVGVGAGNNGSSVFNGFWTHNYVLQILSSMGIMGALAFGYQLVMRALLIFKRPDAFHFIMALSYAGIFMASMLQPGEFCPMPYELLTVALFVVLEYVNEGENPRVSLEQ